MSRTHGHRHRGRRSDRSSTPSHDPIHRRGSSDREPDLLAGIHEMLLEDHPLGLLVLVSSLLAVMDGSRHPRFSADAEPVLLSKQQLIDSFLEVEVVETTALLTVIAAMIDDDLLSKRIRRGLADRPDQHLPEWLGDLATVKVHTAIETSHVLGDGDNILLGMRVPDDHELTLVAYIDHNLGTLIKDAFVLPETINSVVGHYRRVSEQDPDTTYSELDPADARARISAAAELSAMCSPPIETDTWPACRPLLSWMLRRLPRGGTGYVRPEWSDDDRSGLTDRFFGSSFAAGLGGDDRDLFQSLLWFGCDYGPGDPMRWSPVSVEILLNWLPSKVVADSRVLSKAPELLRRFVLFCHGERGIRASLTAETLEAVDRWEPDYQRVIRSPRKQGPAALLEAFEAFSPDFSWDSPYQPLSYRQVMLEALEEAVGGETTLDSLNDRPLPDEAFPWEAIPTDIADRVNEVLEMSDRYCEDTLDLEYRTAARRLLAAVAAGDPAIFRRKARANTAAAAICWIIGRANDLFSYSGRGMLVKDLMSGFGITQGSLSQRGATMLRAAGIDDQQYSADLRLGSPRFLVSRRRARIIELRDRYRAMED